MYSVSCPNPGVGRDSVSRPPMRRDDKVPGCELKGD